MGKTGNIKNFLLMGSHGSKCRQVFFSTGIFLALEDAFRGPAVGFRRKRFSQNQGSLNEGAFTVVFLFFPKLILSQNPTAQRGILCNKNILVTV